MAPPRRAVGGLPAIELVKAVLVHSHPQERSAVILRLLTHYQSSLPDPALWQGLCPSYLAPSEHSSILEALGSSAHSLWLPAITGALHAGGRGGGRCGECSKGGIISLKDSN